MTLEGGDELDLSVHALCQNYPEDEILMAFADELDALAHREDPEDEGLGFELRSIAARVRTVAEDLEQFIEKEDEE